MSAGSYYNQTCYPSQADALNAACSAVNTSAADGSYTNCVGLTPPGTAYAGPSATDGGTFTGKLRVTSVASDGSSITLTRSITVIGCERYDYTYFQPLIEAFTAALVAVIAARVLYTRVFSRETL
jgi:hypothetical protein